MNYCSYLCVIILFVIPSEVEESPKRRSFPIHGILHKREQEAGYQNDSVYHVSLRGVAVAIPLSVIPNPPLTLSKSSPSPTVIRNLLLAFFYKEFHISSSHFLCATAGKPGNVLFKDRELQRFKIFILRNENDISFFSSRANIVCSI